jgi:uncharacterized membrane protein YheB (UPF0754 family)
MNPCLLTIPVVTTLLGWLVNRLAAHFIFYPISAKAFLGMSFQGLLPARQQQMSTALAKFAASKLLLSDILEQKLADPANFQKLMPVIEEKIDYFLRVKLKESMPVVGTFVGDKTIQQLKGVFVTELETIFPSVMKSYGANLQQEFDIESFISNTLAAIPATLLVEQVRAAMKKELQLFQWLGALSGLLLGLVSLVIAVMNI